MSVADDPKTFGRTRLSFASVADIDEFVTTLDRFERGELTPDQWRAFRLVRGTYGQRQTDDAQMLRVKIPQGILTAEQLEALAEVGERYSRGFGHITTRQNVQFHFVKLHDVEHAMHRLADAGLTTREACGNSVRNITACHYAGVASDERFDVTPYAEALTRYLLRHPLSSTLPRKFKIAFEGCATDHVYTGINDLGFRAVLGADGARGFRVTAGGGTAIMVKSAGLLHEFLPASEILRAAEAVLRVFHRLGDYQHKQRNRMKFLIKTLGWTRWREEYDRELTACRLRGQVPTLDVDPPASESRPDWVKDSSPSVGHIASRVSAGRVTGPGLTPTVVPIFHAGDEAYARWRSTNARPQKQFGYIVVVATVPLGDLTSEQMRVVGELSRAYGDGTVRVTIDQNLVFRWVNACDARQFYRRLAAAGLGLAEAGSIADVASCPGAESCRLAVTQSRGLGRLLEDHLRARPDLIAAADGARIKISGCPNGCGQHHIATIGFQGSVRRLGSRAVPQYFVMVGGGATDTGATFGRLAAKIPVRRIPEALERLIDLYDRDRSDGESATAFFARVDLEVVKARLADLERLQPGDAVPADFIDLAEANDFAPEIMEGECSA
ncbi:MAG: nitrite reductase [Acidobacteria bacterium 13_1_40CM_65_14]|nr:MAG: nitrite reductase [Acidobacteria bacterium 13_1_40CM_65_14]OLD19568.1 MAG: nitrite reductase [Acidobacteria bacterium 13_1_40CM_3_65_5]